MTAHVTIDGNLTGDPEYGVSDSGKSWARLRVASHERLRGPDGNWKSGPAQYYQVAVFDTGADNAANTFHKGDPVSVSGRLVVEEFERRDGTPGFAMKVFATKVDPAHRGATRAAGKVLTVDGSTPIVVPNPDDPWGPPIYEGAAGTAHTALTAGRYQAATTDGEIVRLTVTDGGARATMTAPSDPSAPAGDPTVHHNATGTAVVGVARTDVQIQAALKQEGFKWSAPRGFWFLPTGLDEQTRALRLAAVQATLAGANITLPVVDHNPPAPNGAPDRPAAVEASKSDPAPAVTATPAGRVL